MSTKTNKLRTIFSVLFVFLFAFVIGNISSGFCFAQQEVEDIVYHKVEVVIVGEGKVELSSPENEQGYIKGERVVLTMHASKGWQFSKVDGVELDEENGFEVTEDVSVKVTFTAKKVSLSNLEKGVHLETSANIIPEDATLEVYVIEATDPRFAQVKNLLSNPDQLIVYDISIFCDEEKLEQLDGYVTLKIKLDGRFDAQKVKVFRVDALTGAKQEHTFLYLEDYVVFQTDHFSLYTFSQSEGFKPVSPSKDGTNSMGLVLIIFGIVGLLAVVGIAVAVIVRKKKN